MLHRAARNAYSWWWASHIRTKQSKWLDQNIQDMEEKVEYILKIIDEDGDSFAKRAEMYYRKRPEIVNFVEDSFRGYRALADRYDHLSKELQSANRTLATVYPERVQLSMDDDDEENFPTSSNPFLEANKPSKGLPAAPKLSIPKIPSLSKKNSKMSSRLMSKKGLLKINESDAPAASPSSGPTKVEALKEIDKIQKEILSFQTEREFVKSSYENGMAKYWEIENQVTEMQARVSSLQDEFGVGTVIEDDEARTLMASAALKSCQDALVSLQAKHEQSIEEARVEYKRVQEAGEKFNTLKEQFISFQKPGDNISQEYRSGSTSFELKNLVEQDTQDLELLRGQIKEQLRVNPDESLTMSEMAEKVDELVDKVIHLETAVFSQNALVKRLRSEASELQARVENLGLDKETINEGSDSTSNKIRELEEELCRVQNFNQSIKDQNKTLQNHFTEASCTLDHLSEELPSVKPDEVKNIAMFEEVRDFQGVEDQFVEHDDITSQDKIRAISDVKKHDAVSQEGVPVKGFGEHGQMITRGCDLVNSRDDKMGMEDFPDHHDIKAGDENFEQFNPANGLDVLSPKGQVKAVVDANPEKGSKESEDNIASLSSVVFEDVKMKEEETEDDICVHSFSVKPGEKNFSQFGPDTHSDHSPIIMAIDNDMKMEEKHDIFENFSPLKADENFVQVNTNDLLGNVRAVSGTSPEKGFKAHEDMMTPRNEPMITRDLETEEKSKIDGFPDQNTSSKAKKNKDHVQPDGPERQENGENQDCDPDLETQELATEEDDQPNWRKLFLNSLEDRGEIILEQYTSILRNYKEVKKKLSEAEKKKRATLFQSAVQIKVLRNANAMKDAEIQSLSKKLRLLQPKTQKTPDDHENITKTDFNVSNNSSPGSDQKEVPDLIEEHVKSLDRTEEATLPDEEKISRQEEGEGDMKVISFNEPHAVSTIEEKIRMDIDDLLEENIEFWMKFSTSFHQIKKFQNSVEDLQEELMRLKENKKQDGSDKHHQSFNSDVRPLYRHLREIQTELTLWLEHNAVLKDDLQNRLSSLSTIQEEITRLSNAAGPKVEEAELSDYQAAKFQGEVLNMKQENNKVADELHVGLERVKRLQVDISRTLAKLDEELGISTKNNQTKNSSSRSRIPLRSFLFGVKLKKQKPSLFACMSPALQKQYSDLTSLPT